MQIAVGQNSYEYANANGNTIHRQPAALHSPGRQRDFVTSAVVRTSRTRRDSSTTLLTPSRNSMLAIQEQTGSIRGSEISVIRTASMRKMSHDESSYETMNDTLERYLFQERENNEKLGLNFLNNPIGNAKVKDSLVNFGLGAQARIFKCLSFTIGGCESIIILKDILQAHRSSSHDYLLVSTHEIPNARRLGIIGNLSRNEAYFNLFRKCHIHRLFIENIGPSRGNFLINTVETVA